jgi:hypothetical protein
MAVGVYDDARVSDQVADAVGVSLLVAVLEVEDDIEVVTAVEAPKWRSLTRRLQSLSRSIGAS